MVFSITLQKAVDVLTFACGEQAACTHPDFPITYHVPSSCDRFSDRAAITCGLSLVQLASASTLLRSGDFAGFAPGAAVCLPDGCDPCSNEEWFDTLMADVMDADLQKAAALGQDGPLETWDITVSAFNDGKDRDVQAASGAAQADFEGQAKSMLSMLKFW